MQISKTAMAISKAAITVVGVLIAVSACNTETAAGKDAQAPDTQLAAIRAPRVSSTTVVIEPHFIVDREYVGTVQAGQNANLGFELSGKIEKLFVDVGDSVSQGAPLIRLDTRLLETEVHQLEAQREQLNAQLVLIQTNLKRQRQLKKKGFSADSDIDSLTSQRDALKASQRQLDASIETNALRQEKSTIYAPYSGVISKRYVSHGDVVNLGSPTLTLLAETLKEAHIGVPVKHLSNLDEERKWQVRVGSQTVDASLINPGAAIDMRSRTVKLRFLLPKDLEALNGQLAYLQYQSKNTVPGFWLPLSGLTEGLRGTWNVYAALPADDGLHQLERRSVQVLYANNDKAFITGAIQDGDTLMTEGLHRVVSGQKVLVSRE